MKKNIDLSKYTTFRVGGEAEYFVEPSCVEELQEALSFARREGLKVHVLGNGSNLLVSDEGVAGEVIRIADGMQDICIDGDTIIAQAGAKMSTIAKKAADMGLSGLAFAHGIPGTIGGGVIMNAGAYGGELAQVVTKVEAMDLEGRAFVIEADALEFSYRGSFMKKEGLIVTKVYMQLAYGDKEDILATMRELATARREKQPLEYPSAGSTFKRPVGHFAGKLIMDAGLSGYTIGGASVSEKHCGFVINQGGATSQDIVELMQYIKEVVYEKEEVVLEPEVIFWG